MKGNEKVFLTVGLLCLSSVATGVDTNKSSLRRKSRNEKVEGEDINVWITEEFKCQAKTFWNLFYRK